LLEIANVAIKVISLVQQQQQQQKKTQVLKTALAVGLFFKHEPTTVLN